ncbi:EF-hand domain-containing protein [Bdellovibrio svalbardensis]|uniref:EF-hand domain-containing protein n=1 Tax=Bdellovibrio svalbardensis TaxID=2972972 RepID=A0ABT6DHL9_9BACT|nr:EF-hand domain-containing protein [Bdellovibrio svalbardensis]MDG0816356.1 EF-hand domain-containing protein [Bdellovibrio svalbardensis]
MGRLFYHGPSVLAVWLSSSLVFAQVKNYPMSVNSAVAGEGATAAPASGMVTRSGSNKISLKINNSCFPTNLRGVANPIAPSSIVTANLVVHIGNSDYIFKASYPADLVTKTGMADGNIAPLPADKFSVSPGGGSAAIYGNSVIVNSGIPATMSVDSSGSVNVSAPGDIYLKTVSFEQTVTTCGGPPVYGAYGHSAHTATYDCGSFMGKNGTLTASIGGLSVSSDKTNLEINVSFPGQTGFCGGYWSPLMVFFDDTRPTFTNVSDFPMYPGAKTSWPEANSPGWFLAIDDGSGKITKKEQLFGDKEGGPANGFEALKELDSNKDGVIDKKDKEFKKLVLWRDANGDGVSQKEEIVKMSSKIIKISLKYNNDILRPLGSYAQERQRSKFWYKDAKGKTKKGDIIDIWLSPAQPLTVTQK